MATLQQPTPEVDYVDLRSLLRSMIEKKWYILGIALLIFIFSVTYTVFKPAKYQASLLLQIQQKKHRSLGTLSQFNQPSEIETSFEEPISFQIALIRSKFILEPVMNSLGLIKKSESETLNKMLANLSIIDLSSSAENNSNRMGILQISFTGNDPELITKILNKIAIVTQQKSIERKSLQAEKKLAFLQQQLPIVKQNLQEAEERLNQYRSTTQKVDIKLQTHSLMIHLSNIDKQLQELQLKKSNLLQQYTTSYPFVRSINEKINELEKRQIETYNELKKLPAADQETATINRDIYVKNNLYMALLNQIHELEVAKTGIISDVQILVPATPPEIPIQIKLSIIGVASLLVGLILGCMFVLIWNVLSRLADDPSIDKQNIFFDSC
jgi:uncharacterized protein involved in exopolysaccharide biosynthesis